MSPHSTSTSPSTVLSPNPAVANTAVVLIDVYNDFLHPDGKLYSLLSTTLAEHDTIAHLREVVACARKHHIPIYYGLHQQWTPDFFDGWNHMAAIHHTQAQSQAFAADVCSRRSLFPPCLSLSPTSPMSKHKKWIADDSPIPLVLRHSDPKSSRASSPRPPTAT